MVLLFINWVSIDFVDYHWDAVHNTWHGTVLVKKMQKEWSCKNTSGPVKFKATRPVVSE